jgi:hypothetical protein
MVYGWDVGSHNPHVMMNEDACFLVFAVATTFVNSWEGGVPFLKKNSFYFSVPICL